MEIYDDDKGNQLDFLTSIDLTGATTLEIKVKKPDGTETTWTAQVVNPATDGKMRHTVPSALTAGDYALQPYAAFSGSNFRGRTAHLRVLAKFT